jgi:Na+/H+-dicarboxylate symporter
MKLNKLTTLIMVAMVFGIIVGYACNTLATSPAQAKEIASYFSILTDIFLRLIKMIIAPLIFATLVSGLAGMGDRTQSVVSVSKLWAGSSVHRFARWRWVSSSRIYCIPV